jgi:outer membrane receptor protein involved in Fe transport
VLPSLNLKYSINEKNALRFAASQTYTMPQFKETAPFLYEDVNFSSFGNPDLLPSTNYNVDLKYDWYLSDNEIISIGGVYKFIKDPISRIRINSAANDFSYVNTEKAFVAGVEAEIRKNILSLGSDIRKKDLSFGVNASYLYTEQVQDDVPTDNFTVLFTHDKGKMQGAAPVLVNTDLSYNISNDDTSLLSTLVFSYFYDKVYSVGTNGSENLIEKSIPTLDFINKFDIKKYKLQLNLGVKNLVNPQYRITQDVTNNGITSESVVSSYRKGMFISFGLNWTL